MGKLLISLPALIGAGCNSAGSGRKIHSHYDQSHVARAAEFCISKTQHSCLSADRGQTGIGVRSCQKHTLFDTLGNIFLMSQKQT